jgi:hypothetical protein
MFGRENALDGDDIGRVAAQLLLPSANYSAVARESFFVFSSVGRRFVGRRARGGASCIGIGMLSSSGLFEETRRDYGRYKSLGHPRSEGRREESELKSRRPVPRSWWPYLSRNFFFFLYLLCLVAVVFPARSKDKFGGCYVVAASAGKGALSLNRRRRFELAQPRGTFKSRRRALI